MVAMPNPFYQVYAGAAGLSGAETLFLPAVREQFDANGLIAVGSAATEFAAYLKSENARWAPIIRATGAKVD